MSVAIGASVALGFLAYRMYVRPAAVTADVPETAHTESDLAAASEEAHVPLLAGLSLLFFAAVFAPTLQWLYGNWTGSVWINTHGLFIPPVMAFMAYEILKRDKVKQAESSPWGFALLVPGLLIVILDSAMQTHYFAVVGLVLCLPGLSLLLLGARRTRLLAFPLFLGVFMIPVPGTFDSTLFLREMTAVGAEKLLHMQGFTVIRTDTVLELPWGTVAIAKACSGLSTLYSAITVASILIYYSQTRRRKLIILALTVPLALGANVIRALVLVMLSQNFGPAILDTQLHEASGVATFAVVLVVLYMISDMPRRARRPA